MYRVKVPRFFIFAFLSVVIYVSVCRITRDGERHVPTSSEKRRISTALGAFSDTLAPNTVCADLVKLTVILGDEDGDSLEDILPVDYTLTTYFDNPSSGTQAMIVYSKEKRFAVAVFRSTEFFSLEDWKTNLNIDLVRADIQPIPYDVELHEGFFNAVFTNGLAELFETKLLDLIDDPALDIDHIYLTGHSMVSFVHSDMDVLSSIHISFGILMTLF